MCLLKALHVHSSQHSCPAKPTIEGPQAMNRLPTQHTNQSQNIPPAHRLNRYLYTYGLPPLTRPLIMELYIQIWHIKSCKRHLHYTLIYIFRLNKHLKHSRLILKAGILSITEYIFHNIIYYLWSHVLERTWSSETRKLQTQDSLQCGNK